VLTTLGLQALFRRGGWTALAAFALGQVALWLALAAWAGAAGLAPDRPLVNPYPWIVTAAELGLPFLAPLEGVARWLPWSAWSGLFLLAVVLLGGWLGRRGGGPRSRPLRVAPVLLLAGLLAAGLAGLERYRQRWPVITFRPWVDYCRTQARSVRPPDLLLGYAATHPTEYSMAYLLDGRWVNLGILVGAEPERLAALERELERRIQVAADAGGTLHLSPDGLWMALADGAGRPRRLDRLEDFLRRLPARGRLRLGEFHWPELEEPARRLPRYGRIRDQLLGAR
jgi:hypothetical protein